MKKKISVSFLSSKNIIDDLIDLDSTDADFIHVDEMDGKFVKSKNTPFRVLDRLSYILKKRLDVHLMVKKPLKLIEKYINLNTEYITLHVELEEELFKYFDIIKSYGIKCGVAINPDTNIEKLKPYLDYVDLILIMSVNPGYGGQAFIEETTNRIKEVKKLIGKRKILVSVDGGINEKTKDKVNDSNILVSGSFVINNSNYQEQIDKLR